METNIDERPMTFLIDTQADVSIIKIGSMTKSKMNERIDEANIIRINGITGDGIESHGTMETELRIGKNRNIWTTLHVVPNGVNIPSDGILGKDFLMKYNCQIDYETMELKIRNGVDEETVTIRSGPDDMTLVLPARAEVARCFNFECSEDCLVPPQELKPGVLVAATIVSANTRVIRVMNTTSAPITVNRNIELKLERLSDYEKCEESTPKRDANRTKELLNIVRKGVDEQNFRNVRDLVTEYADVFHLEGEKLSTNNFYEQKLRTTDDNPVYTKNYRLPHAQKEEVRSQIGKLIENELIEPSRSAYNSPIILVPKKGDAKKWRMCRNLNRIIEKWWHLTF